MYIPVNILYHRYLQNTHTCTHTYWLPAKKKRSFVSLAEASAVDLITSSAWKAQIRAKKIPPSKKYTFFWLHSKSVQMLEKKTWSISSEGPWCSLPKMGKLKIDFRETLVLNLIPDQLINYSSLINITEVIGAVQQSCC